MFGVPQNNALLKNHVPISLSQTRSAFIHKLTFMEWTWWKYCLKKTLFPVPKYLYTYFCLTSKASLYKWELDGVLWTDIDTNIITFHWHMVVDMSQVRPVRPKISHLKISITTKWLFLILCILSPAYMECMAWLS